MVMNVPKSMYGKGPKNNPSPSKSWDTSGSRAYGDSEIRMLNPPLPAMPTLGNLVIKVERRKK